MAEDRDARADVLIAEEELLGSSPEKIFDWFKKRSEVEGRIENILDAEAELKLLAKKERLIDLAIALYGVHSDSLEIVFKKANKEKNKALILACLSNKAVSKAAYSITNMPGVYIDTVENFVEWLKSCSIEEIITLFSNEGIGREFLIAYFEGNDYWMALDEERRAYSIVALSDNPIIQQKYDGPWDGYAEYSHNKLFDTCWNLAETLPVSIKYAQALGDLYEKLLDKRYKYDALTVAKRWMVDVDEDANKKKWSLNGFEYIRAGIYKCLFEHITEDNSIYLENEDIAYRAVAYSKLMLTEEEIESSYEKDKLIAIRYLLKNNYIWRFEKLRYKLYKCCSDADGKYNDNYLDCCNDYNYKEEDIKKLKPEWFVEEEYKEETDEDDLQVTVGMLKSHLQDYTYNQSVEILTEVFRLKQDASAIRWLVIGCLLLLLKLVLR